MQAFEALAWLLLLAAVVHIAQSATISNPSSKLNEVSNQTSSNKNSVEVASKSSATDKSKPIVKKNDAGWKYETEHEKTEDQYRKFSGIRYTPLDLAEYILRTRDEEGVALAIEELLREGLIDREEAILYLESVKKELANLKGQYDKEQQEVKVHTLKNDKPTRPYQNKVGLAENRQIPNEKRVPSSETPLPQKAINSQKAFPDSRDNRNESPVAKATPTTSSIAPVNDTTSKVRSLSSRTHLGGSGANEQQTKKDGHKQRLAKEDGKDKQEAAADSLYEEYLLENVIYELAKDMFSQSMARDDASAEQLLSRFASFLETELADKKFSKESQEKILDTVSAALIESLRERLYLQN